MSSILAYLPESIKSDPNRGVLKPGHFQSDGIIYLPASWDCVLPAPANIITPAPALFEYSNKKLLDLESSKRDDIMREMAMMFDNTIAYLLGEKDRNTFAKADGDFFRAVNRMKNPDDFKRESRGRPTVPGGPQPTFTFNPDPAPTAAEVATGKGKRLAKVLRDLLGLQAKPTGDTYDAPDGITRYKLYSSRGQDGLTIQRRNPVHPATWLQGGVAYTQREVAACLAELDRQVARAIEGAEWKKSDPGDVIIPKKVVIERGPVVAIPADPNEADPAQARKDRNDAKAREAFMKGAARVRQQHQ